MCKSGAFPSLVMQFSDRKLKRDSLLQQCTIPYPPLAGPWLYDDVHRFSKSGMRQFSSVSLSASVPLPSNPAPYKSHLLHLYVRSASITSQDGLTSYETHRSITSQDPRCITSYKIYVIIWQECMFFTRHYVRGPKGTRLKLRHISCSASHFNLRHAFWKRTKSILLLFAVATGRRQTWKTFTIFCSVRILCETWKSKTIKPYFLLKMD